MYITASRLNSVPYPRLHDSLMCISRWNHSNSIHSMYVDPKGEAVIRFDTILPESVIRMILSEFIDRNWAVESFMSIPVKEGITHEYDYSRLTTAVYTPEGVDIRR